MFCIALAHLNKKKKLTKLLKAFFSGDSPWLFSGAILTFRAVYWKWANPNSGSLLHTLSVAFSWAVVTGGISMLAFGYPREPLAFILNKGNNTSVSWVFAQCNVYKSFPFFLILFSWDTGLVKLAPLPLNLRSDCLNFLSAGIICIYYYSQLNQFLNILLEISKPVFLSHHFFTFVFTFADGPITSVL